jgi:UDP-N-acetylmuramoylalanine--D-glutamate ligase
MMKTIDFNVIVGMGDTGLACARYLQQRGAPFAIIDSRENPPQLDTLLQEFKQIDYHVGGFPEKLLDRATEIIVSPGVSLEEPAIAKQVAKNKSVIGDIELFAREVKKPVVGITGSNGKTTVTTLVGLMVEAAGKKAAVCGNIGDPVLDMLRLPEPDYYVVELSSFQLERTYSLRPAAAVILNISPNHLDRHVDLENYMNAKRRIYHHCQRPVVNFDEPHIWQHLSFLQKPLTFSFNAEKQCDFYLQQQQGQLCLMHRGQSLLPATKLKLHARHHLKNALAALALGFAIDLPVTAMLEVLRKFAGLPHRCQWVRNYQGVDYYNDSKGTSIAATEAALISIGELNQGQLILIAGGQSKGVDFSSLRTAMKQYVSQLILIGEDAPLLEKTFHSIVPIVHATSMDDAVSKATNFAKPGDAVLLSPACASFDMFNNYKHRGEVFIKAVESL